MFCYIFSLLHVCVYACVCVLCEFESIYMAAAGEFEWSYANCNYACVCVCARISVCMRSTIK